MHLPAAFNENPVNIPVVQSRVATYECPSDPNAGTLVAPESGPGSGQPYRMSSYRAMAGRGDPAANIWLDDPAGGSRDLPVAFRGMMHGTSRLTSLSAEKFTSVSDGTSNTIMLTEYSSRSHPRRAAFWACTYTAYSLSSAVPQTRTLLPDYDQCASLGDANPCKRASASMHTANGLNVALGDGSVRFIKQTISMDVWIASATIAGGEVVNLDN